jgi:hypothetical protein
VSDLAQLDLFARPVIATPNTGTIDERFQRFLAANGHVYAAFILIAREYLRATGRTRVGAKAVFEEMRWRFAIRTRGEHEYQLNNSYVSRLARLAAERETDLSEAFEFRKLRAA